MTGNDNTNEAVDATVHWTELVDPVALEAWMDTKELGAGPIANASLVGGGTQNILLRFDRAGRTYILRRGPRSLRKNSNDTMRREMRLLAALEGSDVPHPGFIAGSPEEDVLGVAFYLMEPIVGFNAVVGLPSAHRGDPALRREMGLSLVDGMTALAAVDYRKVGLEGFGKPEGFLERQVPRWRAQLESYGELPGWPGASGLPHVRGVAEWLEANRPATFTPGILHGDYHLGNVMFREDSGQVAAIVDWELCTIGDPLVDLGWLLSTWPDPSGPTAASIAPVHPWDGFPRAGELVERYRSRSTRDLSALRWYAVLACYKFAIIIEGTHARACAGMAPMETGNRLHAGAVNLFERAQRWLDGEPLE